MQLRLTAAGFTAAAVALGLGLAGLGTGNNAVLYIACTSVAALAVDTVFAYVNVRNIGVSRRLPAEIVAERDVSGTLVLDVRRGWPAARHLTLCEQEQEPVAVLEALPGATTEATARWRWSSRGRFDLGAVEVSSNWPFGLVSGRTRCAAPGFVIVYPVPRASRAAQQEGSSGSVGLASHRGDGVGDFAGLRRFRDGDVQRRIHWPTSARVGRPMVVERAADDGRETCVRVRDVVGRAWEAELSAASGAVDEAMRRGLAVSLELPDQRILRARGAGGRRLLLETLAVQPFRDGGR